MINHHLTDQILMAYSAGTLPEAFNLMVATHVSLCDTCRARMESFDAVGGTVLDDMDATSVTMQDDALSATLALIAGGVTDSIEVAPPVADDVLPGPLHSYVGGGLDHVRWKPIGMGVKQAILPTSKGASARLLFIPAGAAMPDHGHNGIEMTMVLQGAFQDDDEYFARGDVEFADADLHHTPVADIHEDCICLAVTDAPLRFQGILPKIVQKFARI